MTNQLTKQRHVAQRTKIGQRFTVDEYTGEVGFAPAAAPATATAAARTPATATASATMDYDTTDNEVDETELTREQKEGRVLHSLAKERAGKERNEDQDDAMERGIAKLRRDSGSITQKGFDDAIEFLDSLKLQRQQWKAAADSRMNMILKYTKNRRTDVRSPTRAMSPHVERCAMHMDQGGD